MSAGRLSIAAAALAVTALLVAGLIALGGSSSRGAARSPLTLAQMRARLSGSPPPLAALHNQAGELLGGGLPALQSRLTSLRGQPLVINKWASWCAPCRAEAGAFQGASVSLGRQVAFIGLDSQEASRGDGLAFMRSFPMSHPSYYDRSGTLGSAITDSSFTPVTVFYDRHGGQYIHQGPYPSQDKLEADIRHYALRG
jgi:thiol-disulfide isomerase/thioredoxin